MSLKTINPAPLLSDAFPAQRCLPDGLISPYTVVRLEKSGEVSQVLEWVPIPPRKVNSFVEVHVDDMVSVSIMHKRKRKTMLSHTLVSMLPSVSKTTLSAKALPYLNFSSLI